MGTKIIKCSCNHPFQDELYGFRNRVGNEMKNGQFKCSVCGNIAGSSQPTIVQVPKAKEEVKETQKKDDAKKVVRKAEPKKDIKAKGPEKKELKKSLKGGKR